MLIDKMECFSMPQHPHSHGVGKFDANMYLRFKVDIMFRFVYFREKTIS